MTYLIKLDMCTAWRCITWLIACLLHVCSAFYCKLSASLFCQAVSSGVAGCSCLPDGPSPTPPLLCPLEVHLVRAASWHDPCAGTLAWSGPARVIVHSCTMIIVYVYACELMVSVSSSPTSLSASEICPLDKSNSHPTASLVVWSWLASCMLQWSMSSSSATVGKSLTIISSWMKDLRHCSASTMSPSSQLHHLQIVIPAEENAHSLETDKAMTAEMRREPNRMGLGRGPSTRSASHYSKAGARIPNLWNSWASHLCYPHFYLLLSYLFIARIRFRIKHSCAESCVTRSCVAWLSHIFTSFPPSPHLRFAWTIVLPGCKDIYNTLHFILGHMTLFP